MASPQEQNLMPSSQLSSSQHSDRPEKEETDDKTAALPYNTPVASEGILVEPDRHISTGTSIIEPGSISDMNGRLYHGYKEGKYLLPNDPAEQDRLDFQHTSTSILLDGKLGWAPFDEPPRHVLDVATGTGIWANEFASEYPSSNVVGSDLSLIQPDNKPPNCSFVQEDAEDPWILHDVPYNYIHLRYVHTCFDNPRGVIKSAFDNLAPGGWIEFQDTGPEISCSPEATGLLRLNSLSIQGAAAMGRDIVVSKHYKDWLIQAGFADVKEEKLCLPCNDWPEDPKLNLVGKFVRRMMVDNTRGIVWKLFQKSGLSPLEIEELVAQCKSEFQDTSLQPSWPFYVVYGRKPFYWETAGSLSPQVKQEESKHDKMN